LASNKKGTFLSALNGGFYEFFKLCGGFKLVADARDSEDILGIFRVGFQLPTQATYENAKILFFLRYQAKVPAILLIRLAQIELAPLWARQDSNLRPT